VDLSWNRSTSAGEDTTMLLDALCADNLCHFWLDGQCPSHKCTGITDNSAKMWSMLE